MPLASLFTTCSAQTLPSLTAVSIDKGISYSVFTQFGTPGQDNLLRVDIAQPYIWVVSASHGNEACDSAVNSTTLCAPHGLYNSTASNTSVNLNSYQELTFLNGIEINGSIMEDTAFFYDSDNFTGYEFPKVDFMAAEDLNVRVGALGLAGKSEGENDQFPNITFLSNMVAKGLINSSSYSFFPEDNENLKLTFGGLNPNEFINDLVVFQKIPFQATDAALSYDFPIVPITGISVVNSAGTSVGLSYDQYPVLLDSRITYSLLPYQVIISLAIQLNAYYSYDDNVWLAKCSTGTLGATLAFLFGNLTVQVPVSSFMTNLYDEDDNQVNFDDGDPACILTVLPNSNFGYSILGTNFLKSVFLAVDNDNHQIALAQAYNEFYKNQTSHQTKQFANMTKTSTSSIPFTSSLIQSGTIPFASGHNLTSVYQDFTLSFNTALASSVIPPDITARVTHGTIYTGRVGASSPFSTAQETGNQTQEAFGVSLRGDIGFTILGLLFSFLI